MKKLLPIILVICLMLCACGNTAEETTLSDETTAPVYVDDTVRNPLNGTELTEPYTGRVFAVTINNVSPALPHRGVGDADVFFEMLINDYCTRGLALFTDIKAVEAVGSIRSTRYNFTDLALAYDTVICHANGSAAIMQEMDDLGVENISADSAVGYRDSDRTSGGYAWEHTLFAKGESLYKAAEDKGFRMSAPDKNYGMYFTSEGTPANGQTANEIEISFTLDGNTKKTLMKYDAASDKYVFNQYDKEMIDENNGTPEGFKNVIVVHARSYTNGVYHIADIYGSGTGYFACGGKIVPIKWTHTEEKAPFTFTLEDGTPLLQEIGNTYIAISPSGSSVVAK